MQFMDVSVVFAIQKHCIAGYIDIRPTGYIQIHSQSVM
jgi:hypothetical protein